MAPENKVFFRQMPIVAQMLTQGTGFSNEHVSNRLTKLRRKTYRLVNSPPRGRAPFIPPFLDLLADWRSQVRPTS